VTVLSRFPEVRRCVKLGFVETVGKRKLAATRARARASSTRETAWRMVWFDALAVAMSRSSSGSP
jgi:hypothetical protein